MDQFDDAYGNVADYFGAAPEASLVEYQESLQPSLPALDVGCGQGRNSVFLARHGFAVDALDPSETAIQLIAEITDREHLPIRPIKGTFQDLDPGNREYGTALVFGLIPILSPDEIGHLTRTLSKLLAPGGLLFITAFGTWDPAYQVHADTWTREHHNSFRAPDGRLRTYLDPGELRDLFPTLSVLRFWEGLGPEHRHGNGPIERHGLAEAVLQR